MLASEIIRSKRDRLALSEPQIQAFVAGLVDQSWSEGQVAALAMAILLNGMDRSECAALTRAMTRSGQVLDWSDAGLAGPVLDKHSTGGVGDKVSLLLAPIVAACGGVVPMISGRGLGHTGGTLDKLQALPGYDIAPPRSQLLRVLRQAGCAIVGASAELAPADRRLYAIRDITATVESLPLITASILSKKLAAGLQGLVMDVKLGNGAFMGHLAEARALAGSLVEVAAAAGLPCRALITDMNQVLGRSAGNALEVAESIAFLTGAEREPRLLALTLALAAQLLQLGGLAPTLAAGQALAEAALTSGRAADCFARMVAGLGGPADVLADAGLAVAPVQIDLAAPRDGVLAAMDTRAIGLVVVALGGGRRRAGDAVDARVGLSHVRPLGTLLRAGEPLLRVHAADAAAAQQALQALRAALTLADVAPAVGPVVIEALLPAA
jgi:thymidine phosphorylase